MDVHNSISNCSILKFHNKKLENTPNNHEESLGIRKTKHNGAHVTEGTAL